MPIYNLRVTTSFTVDTVSNPLENRTHCKLKSSRRTNIEPTFYSPFVFFTSGIMY
jgi:hypothetical protein